jgi:hypothetical protein
MKGREAKRVVIVISWLLRVGVERAGTSCPRAGANLLEFKWVAKRFSNEGEGYPQVDDHNGKDRLRSDRGSALVAPLFNEQVIAKRSGTW